ncbi:MAG: GNAT family N-acetyltransferase [Paenibacillaceae bacterium]
MEHRKIYHSHTIRHLNQSIIMEGPLSSELLRTYVMHPELDAFRRPKDQHIALLEIADLPEGRIIVARDADTIVGYVTFHYPDEMERWSEGNLLDLIELGAVEVANVYRSMGIGKQLIELAFADQQFANMIVFTTEYYWHWDLQSSGLNVWQYRKIMQNLMESVGMTLFATDDPEICSHPANCLMAIIGHEVPLSSIERFDRLRFQRRIMY